MWVGKKRCNFFDCPIKPKGRLWKGWVLGWQSGTADISLVNRSPLWWEELAGRIILHQLPNCEDPTPDQRWTKIGKVMLIAKNGIVPQW